MNQLVPPNVESNARLLRNAPLLKALRHDLLLMLAAACRFKDADAGEILIDQTWDRSPGLLIITSGEARVERRDGPDRVVLAVCVTGDALGELSLIDGQPPLATVVASTDLNALLLPTDEFTKCLDDSPVLARELLKLLAARFREATNARVRVQTRGVLGRLAGELMELANRQATGDGRPILRLETSQAELGRKIGASREAVNKGLRQLQEGPSPAIKQSGKNRGAYRADLEVLQRIASSQ